MARATTGAGPRPVPPFLFYFRVVMRVFLLFATMFILLWWPVDAYTPDGFVRWVGRISQMPDYLWYIILTVFSAWGVSEVVAVRQYPYSSPRNYDPDSPPDDGYDSGGYRK
ncbi:MAG: hypothetical protein D6698_02255 [Gammaproteobacteria bacterium]|nr:MAG: hypothetical protein D6698_02255 [Gammaproteobacteria bacterium]